ncbi:MAG: AAA family ATPase [Chloroflexi bacterium]|nr:AAA family ATPase [Chloroflexota bacterium]
MANDLLIRSYLKRLRLPVVAQNYARLAKEATAHNQTFQDYLLALLEGEVLQREENAQKLRLSRARFPVIKTLDSFDFTAIPSLNKALVIELSRGSYVERRENVIFIGSYGTGKTHLAIALGVFACRQGKRVRFYTAAGLINELLEAQAQLRISKLEASLAKCDLIILDELGFVPFSKEGAEALFTFCSSRYERGSLVITTNLDFARWKELFGDEALTGALLDRLTHRCHILEMNGESYRFKESVRRKEKT